MLKQDKVKELYFDKKYKQIEIAKELNVSNKYVSKILLKDIRYKKEKENRKKISNEKHKEQTKEYIKNNRKNCNADSQYEYMKYQHNQAVSELSGTKNNINNYAFRKWNSSAYKYNKNKKCYEFDKKLVRSYAIPKYIK